MTRIYYGIQPWTIRRAFARRHDPRPEWRAYYRDVIRMGLQMIREHRAGTD